MVASTASRANPGSERRICRIRGDHLARAHLRVGLVYDWRAVDTGPYGRARRAGCRRCGTQRPPGVRTQTPPSSTRPRRVSSSPKSVNAESPAIAGAGVRWCICTRGGRLKRRFHSPAITARPARRHGHAPRAAARRGRGSSYTSSAHRGVRRESRPARPRRWFRARRAAQTRPHRLLAASGLACLQRPRGVVHHRLV